MEKGTKFILLSTSFFFVAQLLVKLIPAIPSFEIVLMRALVSLVICSYFIYQKRLPYFGTHKTDLLLRGIFGSAGLLTFFYSLQHIPLATATTLINMHPIFTIIFAIFIVKEKPRPMQWIFFFLAFVGVIMLKSGSLEVSNKNFLIGVISAICAGAAYNFIRKLKGKEDPQTIILYLSLVAIPIFLPLTIMHWVRPTLLELGIMLLLSLMTQLAQYFMTRAHQAAQASHIVHYSYVGVVAAVIFGWLLFGETLSSRSIKAISLVTLCIFLINYFKKPQSRSSISPG